MSSVHPRANQNEPIGSHAIMQAFNISQDTANVNVETPQMRSIQFGSRVSALMGPPAVGFGEAPDGLFGERPYRLSRNASKGSVGMKQEWDNVVAPVAKWEVRCEDLEQVPEDFPLERTHRYIEGVDASVIAQRISEALRVNSIEAVFNSKPPKAKCKTHDFVSFRIRLYAGSENETPVVVELQRRKGLTSCFMQACRVILAAAEGKPCEKKQGILAQKPLGQMKCLQGFYDVVSYQEEARIALQGAKRMLRSDKRDTNLLGLENLVSLTNPIMTNPSVSLQIAKNVVIGLDGEDIREDILSLTDRDVFASTVEDFALVSNNEMSRQLALTILANTLSLCSREGCLTAAAAQQNWYRECLIPNLMAEIKCAACNSCNATQAAICLYSLASSSDLAKKYLVDQGILEILQQANVFGIERNELLANETERCLKIMGHPVMASE